MLQSSLQHNKPSFCFIAPTAYLSYTIASRTHLVLAHLVDHDAKYATFYKQRAEAGDLVMMDNSAYELKEPYAPSKLMSLAKQCGASVIVLPDYPFQPGEKTIAAAREFAPAFKDAGFQTFFVPQSKVGETEDWINCYSWAANDLDIDVIGMSILGIPNALPAVEPAFARVVMSQILLDRACFATSKHHHYLGLNAGPALEIPSLLKMGVLNTIDSSNPIWMAILGHEYNTNCDSYLSVRKVNMPVDFSISASKDQATHNRIKHNIALTQDLFEQTETSRVWYAQE